MDGRGASSMRLNFAGIPEPDIREGIRRIGKAISEQVGLLGSLTGSPPPAAPAEPAADPQLADVVALPRRPDSERGRRRQDR
jgi:hypothetical protein